MDLRDVFRANKVELKTVIKFQNPTSYFTFDFTEENQELKKIDLNKEDSFSDYIFKSIKKNNAEYGVGKYGEDRVIYKRSDLFSDEESRSLHLGIDIWTEAGTPVYTPLDGVIHSFANNNKHGDYGPTIILKHTIEGISFHTLYGHLSKESLQSLKEGQLVTAGQQIATLGNYEENVHWPPHLHFQIVIDMQNYNGDYPGVCKPSEKEIWLSNCPDPNIILCIPGVE
jgi:murein DD-endopeptidase MepM/ murein hydrolase activator NlpD